MLLGTLVSVGAHIIRKFPEEATLMLMASISLLYERLEDQERARLLQVLARRFIVYAGSEIADFDLKSPFTVLHKISESVDSPIYWSTSSKWIQLGASIKKPAKRSGFCLGRTTMSFSTLGALYLRRSSDESSPSNEFESHWAQTSISDV